MENCTYAKNAANWWATQIKNSTNTSVVKGLEPFEELLARRIKNTVSRDAQMEISTFRSHFNLISEIAAETHLSAAIPTGYEMRIIMNNVFVYNSIGQLVASF